MAMHEPAPSLRLSLSEPSTASVHLQRLKIENLVKVLVQGKHRYYSLDGPNVASALESLGVLAGLGATSSSQTLQAGCGPRALATITSREHWESRSTIVSKCWDGCRATMTFTT